MAIHAQRLSRPLHLVGMRNMQKLHVLDMQSRSRLKQLIRTRGEAEHVLLDRLVDSKPFPYLLAVEYSFDDGSRRQGVGDALYFDGDHTMFALECKRVKNMRERMIHVQQQAVKYAKWVDSWMTHLCTINDWREHYIVMPMCYTDDITGM